MLLYSTLATITTFLSAIATGLIILKLRRHWEPLSISSVRWLFYVFFLSLCVFETLRCAFNVWMLGAGDHRQVNPAVEPILKTTKQLDILAVHSIPRSTLAHEIPLALLILAGDTSLFAVGVWIFALTYELGRIASMSMDRGPIREAQRIGLYRWIGTLSIGAFGIGEFAIVIREHGYTRATHAFLLITLALHVCGLVYMSVMLMMLKTRGRKYEPVHGMFLPSPVYSRLKRIMIVYALFASQYHIMSIVFSIVGTKVKAIMACMGVSLILYTSVGLGLSIITGCSQTCVLQTFSAIIPEDLEAQFMQHKIGNQDVTIRSVGPPEENPVFVYTDIESSSALWALAEDSVMETATDIHDNIMRSSLPRHDGYEITTCGDSFQLVFPSIKDAVAYCVDVQLQLLMAPWPKELHGVVPATKRQRSGHRLVFSGLRVRMGIHDCTSDDGGLVCARHAITGNMTYTGASEAIAGEVSELGHGGQILVTERVAEWVQHHQEELNVDLKIEHVGEYFIHVMGMEKELYELVPSILVGRRKFWSTPIREHRSTVLSVSLGPSPELVLPTVETPMNASTRSLPSTLRRLSLDILPKTQSTNYIALVSTRR